MPWRFTRRVPEASASTQNGRDLILRGAAKDPRNYCRRFRCCGKSPIQAIAIATTKPFKGAERKLTGERRASPASDRALVAVFDSLCRTPPHAKAGASLSQGRSGSSDWCGGHSRRGARARFGPEPFRRTRPGGGASGSHELRARLPRTVRARIRTDPLNRLSPAILCQLVSRVPERAPRGSSAEPQSRSCRS